MTTKVLYFHNNLWKKYDEKYDSCVTRDSLPLSDFITVMMWKDTSPHISSYAHDNGHTLPGHLVSLVLDGQPCTKESIDAFMVALAQELQFSFNTGCVMSNKLKEKIEQLRIEYLQPKNGNS